MVELHRRASHAERQHEPRFIRVGNKSRLLRVPRHPLMTLQRSLYGRLLRYLPTHDAVHSRPSRGVISNATAHLGRAYVSLRDIANCFPSISSHAVRRALEGAGFDPAAAALVTRLCTAANELPQGPPTSPMLLNLVLAPVDAAIASLSDGAGATYTRYADDIAVSADTPLGQVLRQVEFILKSHGFRINGRKRRDWGPDEHPKITGIVLASSLQPDPEFLKALTAELLCAEHGNWRISERELQGKIAWVQALDRQLGAQLASRHARLVRAAPRRLPRCFHSAKSGT